MPTIGQGYSDYIGTRSRPGQSQLEYFNKQSPTQMGFSNPQELAYFANTLSGRSDLTSDNVFDALAQGFTPRAQALDQIKTKLNNYQQQTFDSQQPANKRASSTLADSISSEQGNYNTLVSEYKTLQEKLKGLSAPNYQQAYTELRTSAGIPGIENDFATNQKNLRELPYVNRMNFGNAGVTTEGQLNADTTQKGIPLEVQQANLLDRLKLAQDFVTNSLKFKEMDENAARQSLSDALNTVFDTINFTRTHLTDLLGQQKDQLATQQVNEQFAFENRITKSFYEIAGTVYRTSDRRPAHNRQEYIDMGGTGDFTDVQKIDANLKADQEYVLDLRNSYPDAGILPTDSAVVAAQKIQGSKLYKDKVRAPLGRGGTAAGGLTEVDQYAQDVFNEKLKLSSVPIKIRAQVSAKVDELKKTESENYDSEIEARIDYDQLIKQLVSELASGEQLSVAPTELIQTLTNKFGKYISRQEIEATVLSVLGIQKGQPSTPQTSVSQTRPTGTGQESFFSAITRNLKEFGRTLTNR